MPYLHQYGYLCNLLLIGLSFPHKLCFGLIHIFQTTSNVLIKKKSYLISHFQTCNEHAPERKNGGNVQVSLHLVATRLQLNFAMLHRFTCTQKLVMHQILLGLQCQWFKVCRK